MKIKCDCGFEEVPENFHAFCHIFESAQHIYIGCPKCGTRVFFQHFRLPLPETDAFGISISHLLSAPATMSKQEAMEYVEDQTKKRGLIPVLELIKGRAKDE